MVDDIHTSVLTLSVCPSYTSSDDSSRFHTRTVCTHQALLVTHQFSFAIICNFYSRMAALMQARLRARLMGAQLLPLVERGRLSTFLVGVSRHTLATSRLRRRHHSRCEARWKQTHACRRQSAFRKKAPYQKNQKPEGCPSGRIGSCRRHPYAFPDRSCNKTGCPPPCLSLRSQ
jgi:hypothetical protein